MKNITLAVDDELLSAAREYAEKQNISFNMLIRRLLSQAVMRSKENMVLECLERMDAVNVDSGGKKWRGGDSDDY